MSCKATTKRGQPCKANALKGDDHCLAHSPRKREVAPGFGGPQEGSGRPRKPRVVDVQRERIEAHIDRWLQVPDDARDAVKVVILGNGEEAFADVQPDHQTRMAAYREVMDRSYGRPKQQTEITGAEGGPIEHSHMDLGRLSGEELELWRELVAKADPA